MTKVAIVTGSAGLVGSQCVKSMHEKYDKIIGIDNNMREKFFGREASTAPVQKQLASNYENFISKNVDIRNLEDLTAIFSEFFPYIETIIHTAGQPSHDWAAKDPLLDFGVNCTGTVNLLELYRKFCSGASFVFTSTNKVYGDNPNKELMMGCWDNGYRYLTTFANGFNEHLSLDHCKHSVFGASKVGADIMVQEYGRYFGLNTVSFRCGCLTGEDHKGAELHGFLSYLVKCIMQDRHYTIFGYEGKQVRDNIHSEDLVDAFLEYIEDPTPGAVYNMGGGVANSISILEVIDKVNKMTGKNWNNYTVSDTPREGDHKWYISDLTKFKSRYPNWKIKHSIDDILRKIIANESN